MVYRFLTHLSVGLSALLLPATAVAADHEHDDSCMVDVEATTPKRSVAGSPVVIYLNGRGGNIHAGSENSAANRSAVAYSRGVATVAMPRFSRGADRWNRIVTCVQDQFEDFNVRITDRRPSSGSYIMMAVGGHPSVLNLPRSVAGIAPYNGNVIEGSIGFVFERAISSDRQVCESTAHEIGHTLGLDHTTLCSDTMSYGSCGPKAFRNEAAVCGEYGGRTCSSGGVRQNSWSRLVRTVGRAGTKPRRPKPTPPPPRQPPRPDPVTPDSGPRVRIVSAPQTAMANGVYTVQVRAADGDGIANVELLWTNGDWAVALRCNDRTGRYPVRCTRRGDRYTFSLRVGTANEPSPCASPTAGENGP